MTEQRPGRKALFTGAGNPVKDATGEIVMHVRQLNDEIAGILQAAVQGKTVAPLEPARFGEEYRELVAAVNVALPRLAADRKIPQPAVVPPVSATPAPASPVSGEDQQTINDLRRRLDMMVKNNPVPMLVTTPDFFVVEANTAYIQMSGIRESDLLKTSIRNFAVTGQTGEGAKVALQEKRRAFGEVTVELPSGVHTLEQYCIPISDSDGTLTSLLFVYNDITAQAQKNREIVRLKSRADTVVQQNPMPIIIVDPSFTIRVVNDTYVQMSGIDKAQLMRMSLKEFRVIEQTGAGLKQVIQDKKRSYGEVVVEFPKSTRRLQQYGIPILDNNGNVESILIVYNDVTEERKKMDEIVALHQMADTIVQENPIPILMTTPKFIIEQANTAYVRMSGFERDRIAGMSLHDVKILAQSGEGAKVAITSRRRAFGEVTVELPSGTHILEQYVMPIQNAKNEIEHLLFVYNEVTAQRKSQQDLEKKMDEVATLKQRADIIVMQNPMPIMLMDTSFKIILANAAYLSLAGFDKDRIIGMNAKDFRILEQTGDGLKKVLIERKRSFGEIRVEFPTGVHLLEQYGIPIVDAKDNLSSILCVYNDITARREQEQKIQTMMDDAKANADLLSASAAELQEALAKIAGGDLTFRVSIDEADPLVKLKVDYNSSVESIRALIAELLASFIRLDVTIRDTITSTEEIAKATEQVAISSQKATDNAKSQLGSVEKISNEISEISASIEEIASTTHDVMTHANTAAKEGGDAAEIGKVATTKMQAVEKISGQSVNEITALNEQMHEISKIVNLITDIANQTNLLALNAAIEAARAGEHGRGFAVVAGEVKNLAGESKRASNQIETLIKSIQAKSELTVTSMKSSFAEIKAGIESVNRTVESLNRIISEANVVSLGVTEITKASEDQAQATTHLMSGMESVTSLTHDNQQRMEDMAALAQETSASTEEIASAAQELSKMAEHSRKMLEDFHI
ncbi:MAG: methyl-accepting chemotaxis protein [Methanoregula sp.]|jgi:methyl-accepting chemotaxis protein